LFSIVTSFTAHLSNRERERDFNQSCWRKWLAAVRVKRLKWSLSASWACSCWDLFWCIAENCGGRRGRPKQTQKKRQIEKNISMFPFLSSLFISFYLSPAGKSISIFVLSIDVFLHFNIGLTFQPLCKSVFLFVS